MGAVMGRPPGRFMPSVMGFGNPWVTYGIIFAPFDANLKKQREKVSKKGSVAANSQ